MPPIRRRYFLQCAGSTIALWGLSQAKAIRKNDAHGKALAQDTSQITREPMGEFSLTEAGLAPPEEVHQLPLPGEMMLRIGIDESLDKDPLVSELIQRNRRIEVLDLQGSEVDYIIGRATVQSQQDGLDHIEANSIGLFLPNFHPIANTFGSSIESVSNAINRLSYALDKLLITHIVRAIANAGTPSSKVKATMLTEGQDVQLTYPDRDFEQSRSASQFIQVSSGDQISFQVENQESMPVYLSLLAIDSEQNTILVYPRIRRPSRRRSSPTSFGSQVLPPTEEITIPSADGNFQLRFTGTGNMDMFLVVATHPIDLTPHRALWGSQTLDLYAAEEILQQLNRGAGAEDSRYTALSVKFSVG